MACHEHVPLFGPSIRRLAAHSGSFDCANNVMVYHERAPQGGASRMVGAAGLELATSCSQSRRSSQLSYAPDYLHYTVVPCIFSDPPPSGQRSSTISITTSTEWCRIFSLMLIAEKCPHSSFAALMHPTSARFRRRILNRGAIAYTSAMRR